MTLPDNLATKLENADYTLWNADKDTKESLKSGQIPFMFEIPYEEASLQEEFNVYASKFVIVMNLIK